MASGAFDPEADGREPLLTPECPQLPGPRSEACGEEFLGVARTSRQRQVHLLARDDLRGLGVQQVHAHVRRQQALQQPHSVGHPGSAGEGQRDRSGHG